jgi:hypothetical protein
MKYINGFNKNVEYNGIEVFEEFFRKKKKDNMYTVKYTPTDIEDCKKYIEWLDDHVVRKEYLQLDQEIEKFCDTHDHTGMLGFDECIDKVGYEEVMNFIGKLQKNLHYK